MYTGRSRTDGYFKQRTCGETLIARSPEGTFQLLKTLYFVAEKSDIMYKFNNTAFPSSDKSLNFRPPVL